MEERQLQLMDDFAFQKVLEQLERMDFYDYECSPLINGGCGLGKTTALTSDAAYSLFQRKLNKISPHILLVESRSLTRDQQREKPLPSNFHVLQFAAASNLTDLSKYDIIIIDEAHSLFSDAEFAAQATAPLADWLRRNLCFQIYITANDNDFLSMADIYFKEGKRFVLTFPDRTVLYSKYAPKQMNVLVSPKERMEDYLRRKEKDYFIKGKKGLFFMISAADAYHFYKEYRDKGFNCGFYISQQNTTKLVVKKKEEETLFDLVNLNVTTPLIDQFQELERMRFEARKESIKEALRLGRIPEDIDYLFLTSTAQEGVSLENCHLDFIFIEDIYPLTIYQKMSRYRGILEKVDVFLAQSRIAQATNNTLETIEKLMGENQDYLRGYYEGSRGSVEEKFIWRDKDTGEYKVAENLLAFQLYSQEVKKSINANRTNKDWMRALFGSPAQSFNLIEYKEEKEEDILQDFFKDKIGILLTEQLKENYTQKLIELGLRNKKGEKDFTFDYVAKRCRELNVCDFKSKQASKKDVKNNNDLIYKKYYLQILEK